MKSLLSSFILAYLVGCASAPETKPVASARMSPSERRVMTLGQQLAQAPTDGPQDAAPAVPIIFQVDVYQLAVPLGTFSANEAFWKRMDEQCVDAGTYDVLYRNGIRVGEAPLSELEFFKKFMEDKPVMQRMSTLAPEAQRIEMEMTKEIPEQTIAVFDLNSLLTIRDYDRSANVMNMAFAPAPRKPGCLRISLCPMVRSNRKHIEYTALNAENTFQFVSPEMLYDLNLRADIPQDRFFIVMPSPAARGPQSVGRAFLTKDGHTERLEQILLIIPHPMIVEPGRSEAQR